MTSIEIVLNEGPVEILSHGGAGVAEVHDLWDGMAASEFFPENTKPAFYRLTLRKDVDDPNAVSHTKAELVDALQLLAAAWPFAGGSFMIVESRDVITSPRFESNAAIVRAQLLTQVGKTTVTSSNRLLFAIVAGYRQPPLKVASGIAKAAFRDHGLRRLLGYDQTAWVEYHYRGRNDPGAWFMNLYKVRDFLKKFYGGGAQARAALTINDDWSFFGEILNNNNLRHAEVKGLIPAISRGDIERIFALARKWVTQHLRKLGLEAL